MTDGGPGGQTSADRREAGELPGLALCRLLTLADSALPIGGLAHSFGLEQAVASGFVRVDNLRDFVGDWCRESWRFEAAFAAAGHRLAACRSAKDEDELRARQWRDLNQRLSAFKLSRESRQASWRLGGRLLELSATFRGAAAGAGDGDAWLSGGGHLAPAFGAVAACLGVRETDALIGFGTQSVAGLVSAAQRLMPLGQKAAMDVIWHVKPALTALALEIAAQSLEDLSCFNPLMEAWSMAHPYLPVRLFLS